MLIRCKGYNTGAKEYLEEGKKEGREFSRNELDERVILDGDLDLTKMVYESIPDNGQNRYLSFTMAFREDNVSHETLTAVTAEFKQFLMYAYKDDEFNFYAEAHLPKIKQIKDRKTGDMIDRKPHIHIIIPRKNLLNGNEANPVGMYSTNERYFEAFQEYINQKYNLASPREHVRVDPKDAASVLSRYKGDDFYGKNREFKQELVKQIIETGVSTRQAFYDLVATHGEIKIRNQGKENEYVAVKLPDDAKFTNLKDTIFQDDFVVRRELKKPPLEKQIIQERLTEWPQRARELKYVSKATPSFRKLYKDASPAERTALLNQREQAFYADYGDSHDVSPRNTKPANRGKRSAVETGTTRPAETASGLQNVPVSDVAIDGQAGSTQELSSTKLLQGHAHVHLGQQDAGGDIGLRSPLRGGGGSGRTASGRPGRRAGVPSPAADGGTADAIAGAGRQQRIRERRTGDVIPPYARDPRRRATVGDIEQRGRRLFDPLKQPVESALEIGLAAVVDPGGGASRDPPGVDPGSGQPRKQRRTRSSTSNKRNIPPYALNPHRVATITDIESRTRRLFAPLKVPVDSALVMKLATIKPVAVNRNASTVAAYFNRQIEQSQLLPAQRKAVQRVNKQFFEIRRSIFSDDRLTKRDKAQLVSVLTFERMKAREAIQNPSLYKEDTYMGSAEIRGFVNNEPQEELADFSISGPGPNAPARDRVKALIARLTLQTNDQVSKERERELSAKDIYTKKSRFGQNVHYLSKTTDKTLFVDTGTAIAMRRTGITEAGVGVALQLATQRFGSTLTINGSAEFKRLVVEAAAKGGMDIHFTDKKMNEALTLRRAELDIDKEGQQIQSPEAAGANAAGQEAITPGEEAAPVVVDPSIVTGELVAHGPADYKGDPNNGPSYFVTLITDGGEEKTVWGVALADAMAEHEFAQGDRIKLKDLGREPVTIQKKQEDGSFKAIPGFRRAWSANPETTAQASPAAAAPTQASPAAAAPAQASPAAAAPAQASPAAAAPAQASPAAAAPAQASPAAAAPTQPSPAAVAAAALAVADFLSPSELVRREAAWRQQMQMSGDAVLTEAEVLATDTIMGHRGEDHAIWLVATSDHTKEGVAMITKYLENDEYREHFKDTLEELYSQHEDTPEIIAAMDDATGFVVPIVQEIEQRRRFEEAATRRGPAAQAAPGVEPIAASPRAESPAPLTFTHNGEAASLGLREVSAPAVPGVEPIAASPRAESPAPLTFTHNGEAASLGLREVSAPAVPGVEPIAASPRVESPAPLTFTHMGQAASLGLTAAGSAVAQLLREHIQIEAHEEPDGAGHGEYAASLNGQPIGQTTIFASDAGKALEKAVDMALSLYDGEELSEVLGGLESSKKVEPVTVETEEYQGPEMD